MLDWFGSGIYLLIFSTSGPAAIPICLFDIQMKIRHSNENFDIQMKSEMVRVVIKSCHIYVCVDIVIAILLFKQNEWLCAEINEWMNQ